MAKKIPEQAGFHPFGELIGLKFTACRKEYSECTIAIKDKLLNPHKVVHGGVLYSMADTGMGGALYTDLDEDESCATVQIDIFYLAPVTSGILTCETKLVHRSKSIAVLQSEVENDGRLVAKALGTYSVFKARGD